MFQENVLNIVKKVPKGKVTTYKAIAKKLNSKAYRAVGNALRNNKTNAPCHRVINSDKTIGGYKGKLNNKEKIIILKKEGIIIKDNKVSENQIISFS